MTHVTIVTGASRGIGNAIARIILEKGTSNKVVAVARSGNALKQLAEDFGADRVEIVVGDVTDPETSKKAVELAVSKFGQLNSVIANAGVLEPVGTIEQIEISDWKKLYDVNFFSIVQLVKVSLKELRKTKGNVLAVSSGASVKAYSGWHAYGSSKAALNHFISSVAAEEKDISALSIAPGVVATSMQQDIREKFGQNMEPDALKKFVDLHKNNELLAPEVPATVYANLALQGWSKDIDGKYLRFDDKILSSYAQ
ncbi:glucose/ribitol dehydrogenase [Scheffersomyces xylosifermentans]|uniref:glucose/ribitol dehydrogenase n=1 Tax=Scheffersomyces xylosifermentans TaxID=1304137 RepID=UPI00315C7C47